MTAKLNGVDCPSHVVFTDLRVKVIRKDPTTGHQKLSHAIVGVWLDMDMVRKVATRAAGNLNGRSREGAIRCEFRYIEGE